MNPDESPHTSDFVNIVDRHGENIRLHFLDWGGSGPALVFIPGMGCTAHIFDCFAPRFTNSFRVLALTRRGHGDSDYPETGYDADTLAYDLKGFLDALGVDRAILVGHSLGFVELSRFAHLFPERVLKLIWLDAAYDRTSPVDQAVLGRNPMPKMMPPWPEEPLTSIEAFGATVRRLYPSLAAIWGPEMEAELRSNLSINSEGIVVEKVSDTISDALNQTMKTYFPDYAGIHLPMLALFVLADGKDFLSEEYMTEEQKSQVLDYFANDRLPHIQQYIEAFRRSVPQARVAVIPNGHHYCFIKQADQVYEAMHAFLLEG